MIAVAVGVVAVTLFVADKWFDLDRNLRFAGIIVLLESTICALSGYPTIYFVGSAAEDVVHFSDFAVDFANSRAKATLSAILNITRSGETNVVVRRHKRVFIIMATLLVIVAAGVVVAGRALGQFQNSPS